MTTEDQVLAAVDGVLGEAVELCRELVRVPTLNPPGAEYRPCAELLGAWLRRLGYDVVYVAAEGLQEHTAEHPRVNVVGTLDFGRPGPTVHFNGHIDVVPPGGGWTRPPFGAVIEGGRIYGRGTADMKAGIAAMVYAVEALRRAGYPIPGRIEQSGTVDEESGGFAGVAYLCRRGLIRAGRTDYVVITEPLDPDRVCIGHRGVYWFEVTARGRVAHGSMPHLGVNAIELMSLFIDRLRRELKPRLERRETALPVVPEVARRPSMNVNGIVGGQTQKETLPTPCVADSCRAVFDRRFIPEESVAEVRREVEEILLEIKAEVKGFDYEWRDLMVVEPVVTEGSSPLVRAFARAVKQVYGYEGALVASPGTYDHKHVRRLGGVEHCIAYGPGRLELAHQPDEYIEIEDLRRAMGVMALGLINLWEQERGQDAL
ncbi:MAG: succinyl-diaminopimelate desuccinylase [Chloroflexota bacterium]